MTKANLPVNFKDDILKENMNGKRRFNMIQNSDGTVSFEDVTDYTQVGSTFGAAQINATNTAVNNAADASKIIDSLDTIKANTKSGYIAGALAVKELSSNLGGKVKLISYKAGNFYNGTGIDFTVERGKKYVILQSGMGATTTYSLPSYDGATIINRDIFSDVICADTLSTTKTTLKWNPAKTSYSDGRWYGYVYLIQLL